MPYSTFSAHAPTGSTGTKISPNEYAPEGKNTLYPINLSVYVQKIAFSDGSQSVTENRTPSELIGSKLFLFHKPLVDSAGNTTAITTTNGTIDTTLTDPSKGSIVFSTIPNVDFNISYIAAPDCFSQHELNVIQDDVMELQQVVGHTANTGFPGLLNLEYGLFNNPDDPVLSGQAQNAVFLPWLGKDIIIGNQTDTTPRDIQIGVQTDTCTMDVSGWSVGSTDATQEGVYEIGLHTGDKITYQGEMSGEGPLYVGGTGWVNNNPGYSGAWSGLINSDFFTGSMLRVYGNVSVLGGIHSVGAITVVHTTGQTSTILGDFTVRDELFVYGVSHLVGRTETNRLDVQDHLYLDGDLVADNLRGGGGQGQTLVDNLDASEVAHTYDTVMNRRLPNSIISAPIPEVHVNPQQSIQSPYYHLDTGNMVGDLWCQTGLVNANAGPSGAHPYIIQVNTYMPIVSGFTHPLDSGRWDGVYCSGLMDPGSTWIRIIGGNGKNYTAPIYAHDIQETDGDFVTKINVYCPVGTSGVVKTNDICMLYNPYSVKHDYIRTTMGATPTFNVSGSADQPLRIAFEDTVRILGDVSANYSLTSALVDSVSGNVPNTQGVGRTGVAYIFASSNGVDIESAPHFLARPIPFRMPGETIVGEVVAKEDGGSSWIELETTAYRPGAKYDSAWLPVGNGAMSGRALPSGAASTITPTRRAYFNHNLGADIDIANLSVDLYLGRYSTGAQGLENQTHVFDWGMMGQDARTDSLYQDGAFTRIPLTNTQNEAASAYRDASMFYLDGKVLGVEFDPSITGNLSGDTLTGFNYLRVVARRDA